MTGLGSTPPSSLSAVQYGKADDTTWPLPGDTEWQLRYGEANLLHAASIVAAYAFLTDPTITDSAARAALVRARKAVRSA